MTNRNPTPDEAADIMTATSRTPKRCPACNEVIVHINPRASANTSIGKMLDAMDAHIDGCAASHTPAIEAAVNRLATLVKEIS